MWYYSKNGAQLGPIGPAEMESKLKAGEIASTDLVWKEGMADWLPAGKVPEIQALLSPPAPPSEPSYGERPAPVSPSASPYAAPASPYSAATGVPVFSPSSGLAIASMVCGIVSVITSCVWCIGGLLALVAIILGHIAFSKAKADPSRFGGKGMAAAGLVTGYFGIVISILFMAFGFWVQQPGNLDRMQWLPPEARDQLNRQIEEQRAKQR